MPDAFFQSNKPRKRKRAVSQEQGPSTSKKFARSTNGKKSGFAPANGKPKRKARDEELSDETSDAGEDGVDEMDLRAPSVDPDAYESAEEDENETPAEKRLRLAKLYLDSVKQGLALADGEYDAAEIDRDLISARLKQDVLEHSGKLHLFVADSYDLANTPKLRAQGHKFSVTAAAASEDARWLYTAGKDGCLVKWDLHTGSKAHIFHKQRSSKGKERATEDIAGHTDEIWAIAISPDGRLVASGGKDRRVGVWDVEKNEWVKGFGGHRDSISTLAFRKSSTASTSTAPTQLYTGSYDRTIKLFDLSPATMGYVETLFGHQAPVLSLDSLMGETAVSVGGRDKSVRFWKVPEESQLVFRGGGRSGWEDVLALGGDGEDAMDIDSKKSAKKTKEKFVEGSIETIAMIDESTFVSGGDSGSICLWATQKKKPVFTQALAHGMDESHVHTEDVDIVRKPRWITALGSLRYSDLFASGSWDGEIRLWKIDPKLRSFTLVGSIPAIGVVNSIQIITSPRSTVDTFAWISSSSSASKNHASSKELRSIDSKKSALLIAGVGREPRLGGWIKRKGQGALNGALVVALHQRTLDSTVAES